jgi:hypothetical protein
MPVANYSVNGGVCQLFLSDLSREDLIQLGTSLDLMRAVVFLHRDTPLELRQKLTIKSVFVSYIQSMESGEDYRKNLIELDGDLFYEFFSRASLIVRGNGTNEGSDHLLRIQQNFGLLAG